MASQKTFVSPGVFTSEKDLTFVSQQVGVTTLGLAGETVKGPAFEPIFITNYDEYTTIFGGLNPEKFSNNKPKYELSYIAKSYLTQSNQLFVTRVLGLTGYDAGNAWAIITKANYNPSTIVTGATTTFTANFTGSSYANITDVNAQFLYNEGLFPNGTTLTTSSIPGVSDAYPEGIVFVSTTGANFSGTSATISVVGSLTGNSGSVSGTVTTYTATAYTEYNNLVLAVLRSRGNYFSDNGSLKTWSTSQTVGGLKADLSSALTNPLAEITLSATSVDLATTNVYNVSLDRTSTKYITGILGEDFFDRNPSVFVEEFYPNMLQDLLDGNFILGLKQELVYMTNSNNYKQAFQTPETPWVVSELRGNQVFELFKFISISDGNEANREIKVSIRNIKLDTKEFDVIVRSWNDTDSSPLILENYPKCVMDPSSNNFIARRIGTADGEFTLNSRYIMMVMNSEAPTDAVPAGFQGYRVRDYVGTTVSSPSSSVNYLTPFIDYKTVYDPENERIKRVYLGISDTLGIDQDMFNWKGLTQGDDYWSASTKGFHMDSGATIAGNYEVGAYEFRDDAGVVGTDYESVTARKFTLVPYWGFDGWDSYRRSRTNKDAYRVGKTSYTTGAANGQFTQVNPGQDGDSDLYAYLRAIRTFANPEAVNINVLATPGIDYGDNSYLVQETIDMTEEERADSVYIVTSPENVTYDTSVDVGSFGFNTNEINDAESLTDLLDAADIDSNYTATYWPWIQERDTENNVNIWLPPTLEVVRNIALTDNVSFPWYAVAGYTRGLTNALQARYKLTEDDRDTLYEGRVNPMATFSDVGVVIWGNKNLQVKDSVLDRLNIRRLLLQARKLITAVGVRLLFEQNDQIVRNQFLNLVNPILDNIRKERGLADFRVQLSNDPEEIDRNEMRGKIFLKPIPSLEYIFIEFNVTPTGASFDNI
jgi:hypothetical protein